MAEDELDKDAGLAFKKSLEEHFGEQRTTGVKGTYDTD